MIIDYTAVTSNL